MEGIIRVVPERCGAIVVAVCSDGDQALREIEHLQPDVAMLDLRMPGLDGRQVLRAVNERGLTTRILLCSASLEPPLVHAALGEGATGYLAKTASWDEICGAVLAVARGQIWLSPSLQAGLNRQVGLRNRPLSDRERQVITLAADGLTDDQIARRLFVSRETVRTNLKRSSNKLGVSGRTALVATAIRQGLLE
ncbi:MAG: response regulator transcription factor [Solirubrobacteraceae bacterium MAG38_C4-C5]|nr:response regulator transcription factor [Candidatus Siliceabacter maunaloa]